MEKVKMFYIKKNLIDGMNLKTQDDWYLLGIGIQQIISVRIYSFN